MNFTFIISWTKIIIVEKKVNISNIIIFQILKMWILYVIKKLYS